MKLRSVHLLCLVLTDAAPVVWRASKLVTRRLAAVPGRPLSSHFARPETPAEVLRFNPGIASASKIEDIDSTTSIWLGRTAPMKFGSGVEVTSVMKFRITFVPPLMNLEVLETSTESTGPRIFTRMIDAILPKVSSRTSVRLDGDQLTSDAHLELELPLPGWLPLPRSSIEKLGPPILEKQLGGDLVALLDRYAAAYAAGRGDLGLESGLGR